MIRTLGLLAGLSLLPAPATAAQTVTVSDAWSRPALDTGVVYLTIRNRGAVADRLVDATSGVARHVEFHQTSAVRETGGMAMGSSMAGMPDMATEMRRVRSVAIPAGGTVAFAPGSLHAMLIGLRRPLTAGRSFELRLRFARAGWIAARSQVRGI
jgi:copper(I)-binding protein